MVTFGGGKGDFSKTKQYLEKLKDAVKYDILNRYGKLGVSVLSSATPVDTGQTAASWYYNVEKSSTGAKLVFYNSNVNKGFSVAIGLQFGHGTGTGGWVSGRDYINPAIQPVFDKLVENLWKEVTSL